MEDTAQSEVLAKKELLPPLNWVPRALAGLAKAELGKAPPPAPASCLRWGGDCRGEALGGERPQGHSLGLG